MLHKFRTIARPPRRKLLLQLIDLLLICIAYLAVWLTVAFAGNLPLDSLGLAADLLIVVLLHALLSGLFRVNHVIWRYASAADFFYIFVIHLLTGVLACTVLYFAGQSGLPLLANVFGALCCAGTIALLRIAYQAYLSHTKIAGPTPNAKRLLIVGAGTAGLLMLDEIRISPNCGLDPVAFADDNPQKLHRTINGIRVMGTIRDIPAICAEKQAELIYIAIPSATNEQRARILEECAKTNCTVKILPLFPEIADISHIMNSVRDITPEELLGREPVKVADESILAFVRDKTILVTGGGGSIGQEICRQVAAYCPKRLIILDIYENNAYTLQQELRCLYEDKLNLEVYITTVCDRDKLDAIFTAEKPDIVIHAAAHKHVPLMETVPDEAVKNNIFGTLNTAMAAREHKAERFILISTDKAVNPTNIMGATKRVCEMIIQHIDAISPDTTFAAVRFGNVLGSNGSVIPLFKQQIEAHHDLTVTHPEMIRYFMTIPEASQLVLTAGAMAQGGEIFVLDMGEPVKIDDLARKMIRLSGLTIGKDINIRYVGLRPGEKLYEELLMREEGLRQTLNRKIYIGSAIAMNSDTFCRQLDELHTLVYRPDVTSREVEQKLMEIVPTFKRAAYTKPLLKPTNLELRCPEAEHAPASMLALGQHS